MGITHLDRISAVGVITITAYRADVDIAHEVKKRPKERKTSGLVVCRARNIVTTAGKNVMAGVFGSYIGYSGAQYLAIGSGTGGSLDGVALYTEVFRKVLTGVFLSGNQVDCSTFILAGEANFAWTELGLFGNGASATPGSGVMMTHATITLTGGSKANTQQYTVDYNVTVS